MRSILLLVYLIVAAYSQNTPSTSLSVGPQRHKNVIKLGEKYISEIECMRKLDSLLKRKWSSELNKIPTTDLGNLGKTWWEVKDSTYTKYDTYEQEWLMEDMPPAKRIEQCFRKIVPDVIPFMNQNEIRCLNDLFTTHVVREIDHQDEYENVLKNTTREDLPFRKFINFIELIDVMFQNRNPDAMTDLERVLYEHASSYLITDEDRERRTYVANQDCDWVNARALREAPNQKAKFKEFASQVHRSVDKEIGNQLITRWNLNQSIPLERYERWLLARQNMLSNLDREVEKLRKRRKDAQWLCEYATKLSLKYSKEQLKILLTDDKSWVHLEVSDVASKARTIEKALGKLNDFRHLTLKEIADEYEEGTRCMFSMLHLIQNHRRYDFSAAFMKEAYSYPEIYCGGKNKIFGLVQVILCNCVGSFCIAHPLAAIFSDEYVFAKGSDGKYQVVRSGKVSNRKIMHCHTLVNGIKVPKL